jgi:uncharacterized protein (TIGR02145 family)
MRNNSIFNSLLNAYELYDYDNNMYTSVTIGGQEWLVQNLKVTKYSDGTPILYAPNSVTWVDNASSGAYCEYDNSVGLYKNTRGYLYNWYAVDSSHGFVYLKRNSVRETDWKVPNHEDLLTLRNFIGDSTIVGGKLKETGTSHWESPNLGATDEYGFKLLPGGTRGSEGDFYNISRNAVLWSSTFNPASTGAYYHFASYNNDTFGSNTFSRLGGHSIRCLRDTQGTPIFKFTTDASLTEITPTFTASVGNLKFNLGDASYNVDSSDFSHAYSVTGNKYVKVFNGTSESALITSIKMDYDNLVGVLDISALTSLTSLNVNSNSKLTSVNNPSSNQLVTYYDVANCSLNGTLDLRSLKNLGGEFKASGNTNLVQVLNPSSSQIFTLYNVGGCNISGTLNISGLSYLGGSFSAAQNPGLTQIINPVSTETFNIYYAHSCNLTGTLDVSGLSGLGGNFSVNGNSGLNNILNPVSSVQFSSYNAYNCDISGTLNLSTLSGLGGTIALHNNSKLSRIINPNSSTVIDYYSAYSCNLSGTLDVSGFSKLGGEFRVNDNPNLTSIINPSSNQPFVTYNAYNCNLTGTLDISSLYGLSGLLEVYNNPNLTRIINPVSSQIIYKYSISDNSLNAVLDVSGLTNLGGQFWCSTNRSLTRILFPTFNREFTNIYLKDCSLDLFTVNDVFSKLNTWYTSHVPTANAYFDLSGGHNMKPTDGSSNVNIVNITKVFDSSSAYDVSIYINYT